MSESSTRVKDPSANRTRSVSENGAERTAAMTDRLRSLSLEKPATEPRRSKTRWGRWLLALLVLGGVGGWAAQDYVASMGRGFFPDTAEVETITVQSEFSEGVLLDTAGFLVVKARVDVSPKVPGVIVELPIEEGQKVKSGDLLARLDDEQHKTDFDAATAGLAAAEARLAEVQAGARDEELEQARTALDSSRNRLELAKAELNRAEQLGNVISQAELELRKANLKDAEGNVRTLEQRLSLLERGARKETIAALEAEVQRVKATLAKAQYMLNCTRVLAPISGTILQKNPEVGEMIRPEAAIASALCVIADTSKMEAEVDIQERDIEQVRIGQPCRITVEAYADASYEGVYVRRGSVVNKNKGTVGAHVKLLNPDEKLLPDMNCRVVFLKDESSRQAKDTLRIPQSAVVTSGESPVVFLLDGETARSRKVVLGEKQGDQVEIVQGLVAGETVILPGNLTLHDGRPVKRQGK